MKKLAFLAIAGSVLAAALFVTAQAASSQTTDRAARSYFIDGPKRERFTRTSIAIHGRKIASGYIVKYPRGCDQGRKRSAILVDFGGTRIEDHRFKDVDPLPGGKSVVRGKRRGSAITGFMYGWTTLSDGTNCHFGTHFELKPVSHARWRQYSARARDWDASFPGDG